MDSIDEDDYELEDGFADRGEAPPLQEQVQSIVQLMNELWKNCNKQTTLKSYTLRCIHVLTVVSVILPLY